MYRTTILRQQAVVIVAQSCVARYIKTTNTKLVIFIWQGYMDEDRTFYSVSENAILGGENV